jgi:GTP-binding protein EngB required for normal cell division
MNRSSLTDKLTGLSGFLRTPAARFIDHGERSGLAETVEELLEKAKNPTEVLYVGILGGTGVGKSTLINALAQREISTISSRRPHTDRAIVYRHSATQRGLQEVEEYLLDRDAIHESDAIKYLILVDLPDFDSYDQRNRDAVRHILPFLDVIMWVASPEKYADAAFYDFIALTGVHRENFCFVLNKSDELLTNDGDKHAKLKEVLGDFTFRLNEAVTAADPKMFFVSAQQEFNRDATDAVLKAEFAKLRDFLMKRRDAKEIADIKMRNLFEQTNDTIEKISKLINPGVKLESIKAILNTYPEVPEEPFPRIMLDSCLQRLEKAIYFSLLEADASSGPVKLGMRLIHFFKRMGGKILPVAEAYQDAADTITAHAGGLMTRTFERAHADMTFMTGAGSAEDTEEFNRKISDTAQRKMGEFGADLENLKTKAGASRWLKFKQKFTMWIPVPMLIMRLIGVAQLEAFLNNPTFGGIVKIFVFLITAFFGPEGLVGLLALVIIEGLIILWLASKRLKTLEKLSGRLAGNSVRSLDLAVREIIRQTHIEGKKALEDIEQGLTEFIRLRAKS